MVCDDGIIQTARLHTNPTPISKARCFIEDKDISSVSTFRLSLKARRWLMSLPAVTLSFVSLQTVMWPISSVPSTWHTYAHQADKANKHIGIRKQTRSFRYVGVVERVGPMLIDLSGGHVPPFLALPGKPQLTTLCSRLICNPNEQFVRLFEGGCSFIILLFGKRTAFLRPSKLQTPQDTPKTPQHSPPHTPPTTLKRSPSQNLQAPKTFPPPPPQTLPRHPNSPPNPPRQDCAWQRIRNLNLGGCYDDWWLNLVGVIRFAIQRQAVGNLYLSNTDASSTHPLPAFPKNISYEV